MHIYMFLDINFVVDTKLFSLKNDFKKLNLRSFDGDKPSTLIGISLTCCDSNLHQHGMNGHSSHYISPQLHVYYNLLPQLFLIIFFVSTCRHVYTCIYIHMYVHYYTQVYMTLYIHVCSNADVEFGSISAPCSWPPDPRR